MQKKTLNPSFNWEALFGFESIDKLLAETLHIELWDKDEGVLDTDDSLGSAIIELSSHASALKSGKRVELQLQLVDKQSTPGTVFVSLAWGVPQPPPPTPKGHGGKLCVYLSHADGLRAADDNGLSDPYVTLFLSGSKATSPFSEKTLYPRYSWEAQFDFESLAESMSETMRIEAWDKDKGKFSKDDSLGIGTLALGDHHLALAAGQRVECRVQLDDKQPLRDILK